jgi:hypothetical protein
MEGGKRDDGDDGQADGETEQGDQPRTSRGGWVLLRGGCKPSSTRRHSRSMIGR